MKEYRIKITGEYDVIVLSPNMIARLIDKIPGISLRKKYSRRDMPGILTVFWTQIQR